MNITRIQRAAARIASNQRALVWLERFGSQLTGRDDNAEASIVLRLAGSCDGSKEAADVLRSYAKLSIPSLVEQSIRACVNSIAMDRDAIQAELDRANLPTPSPEAPGSTGGAA